MNISRRQFIFGPHRLLAQNGEADDAPYIVAGSRLYALGRGSSTLGPIGVEHLVGEMGGIWAHPLKVADGLTVTLTDTNGAPVEPREVVFTERLSEVGWSWQSDQLEVSRRERALPATPAYACQVVLANQGAVPAAGELLVAAHLTFLGCWFGGLASAGSAYHQVGPLVLGNNAAQSGWGVAVGAVELPEQASIEPTERGSVATLGYRFRLAPGEQRSWLVLLSVAQEGGAAAAEQQWHKLIASADTLFASDDHASLLHDLPTLISDSADLSRDMVLAQANLRLLAADYPDTGAYFLAGLPEYPQLFGCDTTYSVPGATGGGFAATVRSALDTLAGYAQRACGRVPHEVTTNGRVFHPGNIQETPQYTIAVWDYLRWSGDLEFARQVFPVCHEGLTELVPAHFGSKQFYPLGDGMVERLGMGSRKLDATCYYLAGLRALAQIGRALGMGDTASYEAQAERGRAAFEQDWWLEDEGLYADSMHSDGGLQLDGHWTAVLPVQLGLAAPERAERVMERLEREFVNQWGLVHTRTHEELVWTLPTGLMALACFQQGRAERGLELTRSIALTAQHGTLGTFKELIPQGLCFVQLWSAGLYVQAIFEGLLGLQPDAVAHRLTVAPCMPTELAPITLRNVRMGAHQLDLTISPRALRLEHRYGPQALSVSYAGVTANVAPGASFTQTV